MSHSTFSSSSDSIFLYSDSFSGLNLRGNSLYPFNSHAIVYHAKVPCKDERCRNREKKDNPNCFVKAFRWYTQEHMVPKNRINDRSDDLDEFAAWLDQKYDQFLYDSQRKNAYESRIQILPSVRIASKKSYNPFRKCRRTADCRDGGDGREKCNQSFEVIMQAKELSRPASECLFQNRPASYYNSSKVTVVSSDTVVIKKWSKFKKCSWENQDNELRMTTPAARILDITEKDTISCPQYTSLVEERHSKNKLDVAQTNVRCQCPKEHVVIAVQCDKHKLCQNEAESIQPTICTATEARRPSQASKFSARVTSSNGKGTPPSCLNPTCLYYKEHVKADNGTQYSDHEPASATAFTSCECPVSTLQTNLETENASSHQKMRSIKHMNTASGNSSIKEMCNCNFRRRDLGNKWVCEDTPTMLASDTAQTSDHSIVLDNAAVGGIPILVRIVAP